MIGFEEGVCKTDVISTELASIINNEAGVDEECDSSRLKPSVTNYILIFMFIR